MKDGQIICFRQLPSFLHFSTRRKVLEHASHTYSWPSENSLSNGVWKSKKKFSLFFFLCIAVIKKILTVQSKEKKQTNKGRETRAKDRCSNKKKR